MVSSLIWHHRDFVLIFFLSASAFSWGLFIGLTGRGWGWRLGWGFIGAALWFVSMVLLYLFLRENGNGGEGNALAAFLFDCSLSSVIVIIIGKLISTYMPRSPINSSVRLPPKKVVFGISFVIVSILSGFILLELSSETIGGFIVSSSGGKSLSLQEEQRLYDLFSRFDSKMANRAEKNRQEIEKRKLRLLFFWSLDIGLFIFGIQLIIKHLRDRSIKTKPPIIPQDTLFSNNVMIGFSKEEVEKIMGIPNKITPKQTGAIIYEYPSMKLTLRNNKVSFIQRLPRDSISIDDID